MNKKVFLVFAVLIIIFSCAITTFADVAKYVTQKDGVMYEYDYASLKTSYQNSVIGLADVVLYNDYKPGTLKAIYDTVKGYVDYADIKAAYQNSVLTGTSFDLKTYILANGKPASIGTEVTSVTVGAGGSLTKVKVPISNGTDESLEVIAIE